MNGCILHIEQLLGSTVLVVIKGSFPGEPFRPGSQYQADRFAGFPVIEGKRLLAPHVKQQIPLADGAAYLTTLQPALAMDDLMRCRILGGEARDLSYRMGLCLYLAGEYREAMEEFEADYAQWDDEMRIALIYWHTLSAWRGGGEPVLLRDGYHREMAVGHHTAYELCMAAASGCIGISDGLKLLAETEEDLEYAILAYGLAGCLVRQGQEDQAKTLLQDILRRDRFWISCAYLAAWNDRRRWLAEKR